MNFIRPWIAVAIICISTLGARTAHSTKDCESAFLLEQDMITLARGGDMDAVAMLTKLYRKKILLDVNKDPDLAQKVCVRLLESAIKGSFYRAEGGATFGTWLTSVTTSVRNEAYRKSKSEPHHTSIVPFTEVDDLELETFATLPVDLENQVIHADLEKRRSAWLRNAVASLPPEKREVMFLVYHLGLTHEQAAAKLGVPKGTIASRIHDAKKTLMSRQCKNELL